jgi:type II secretory pathway pseudopilin PulG
MTSHCQNNLKGFTILEVLIAMSLMVFISIAIFQATRQSFKVREILSNEGDFYNSIRLAMDVLNRDIQVIYSPIAYWRPPNFGQTFQPGSPQAQAQMAEQDAISQFAELTLQSKFWAPAIHRIGIRPAIFRGTVNTVSFISLSHVRVYQSTPESEFVQIEYHTQEIKDVRNNGTTLALMKTQNTNAFSLRDKENSEGMIKFSLLEGLEEIKFRYYRADKQEWLYEWDSTSFEQQGRYPDVIEVAIKVKHSDRLKFTGTYRFRPEIPIDGVPRTL